MSNFKKATLRKASFANLLRLAKYLNLHTDGMKFDQVVNLIRWRLHPNRAWNAKTYL